MSWLAWPGAGPVFALATAVSWAGAVVLFKRSGDHMPPAALNYFKDVVGLLLFGATLGLTGGFAVPLDGINFLALLASGAVGIGVADTLFFRSLNLLGAGRSAIVDCLYSPTIVLFAYFMLGERLSWTTALGALLIIAGVLVSGMQGAGRSLAPRELVEGVALGLASVASMGLAIVAVKPILEHEPVIWATAVRMLGGVAALTLQVLLSARTRRQVIEAFVPQAVWRYALPASLLGSYLAVMLWIAGFKYTQATTASVLNQTSTIFVVLLAAPFLREPITRPKVLAVMLGLSGSILALA